MSARDKEHQQVARCREAARCAGACAADAREANLFRLAGMLLRSHYPRESRRLSELSSAYFGEHPDDKLDTQALLRRGWVSSLARFRDTLSRELACR